MKKIIILLFVLQFTTICFAQTSYGSFKVADQAIIYQKVFSLDSITVAKLEKYYSSLDFVSNLKTTADGLEFDMNNISVDYKKFQFTQVNTHISMQTGVYSGKVVVGVKGGKYRVTVSSIQFTGNIGYKHLKEKDYLTRYATKNSGTAILEDWCKPNVLGLLDKAFTDKLEYKKTEDEW